MNDLAMPWGKHQGALISALPSSYLRWLAGQCDDEEICQAADDELSWRDRHSFHFED